MSDYSADFESRWHWPSELNSSAGQMPASIQSVTVSPTRIVPGLSICAPQPTPVTQSLDDGTANKCLQMAAGFAQPDSSDSYFTNAEFVTPLNGSEQRHELQDCGELRRGRARRRSHVSGLQVLPLRSGQFKIRERFGKSSTLFRIAVSFES